MTDIDEAMLIAWVDGELDEVTRRRVDRAVADDPALAARLEQHRRLRARLAAVIDYLNQQILAGAQAVQIFDTWGGNLSDQAYIDFSLKYMEKIVAGLIREHDGRKVPVILFTKGGGLWLPRMADTGADALGLDWTMNIGAARKLVGDKVALQGNMDPSVLYGSAEQIRAEVDRILADFGSGNGHVFNLGHGIHQFVDPEQPKILIDAVHEFSQKYHR